MAKTKTDVEKKFVASQETWGAMELLAKITGVKGKGEKRLGSFLKEETRIFEWIIYHQMKRRVFVALDPKHIKFLKNSKKVLGECESLTNLIEKSKMGLARKYFKNPAIFK